MWTMDLIHLITIHFPISEPHHHFVRINPSPDTLDGLEQILLYGNIKSGVFRAEMLRFSASAGGLSSPESLAVAVHTLSLESTRSFYVWRRQSSYLRWMPTGAITIDNWLRISDRSLPFPSIWKLSIQASSYGKFFHIWRVQACMDRIFGDLEFVVVYLDDPLVFSSDKLEHRAPMCLIWAPGKYMASR